MKCLSWEKGGRTRGTNAAAWLRAGGISGVVGGKRSKPRPKARLARSGIGNKGGRVGERFLEANLESANTKSMASYCVQDLSSASGCGSHS